jgi:hypothetical protein
LRGPATIRAERIATRLGTTPSHRLGDAGASVFNFAVDSWDEKPSLPKAVVPVRKQLEHLLKRQ